MEAVEILQILAQGEDSRNQFKKDIKNIDALASEIVAFSNTLGGKIFVGVQENIKKEAEITGLSPHDIHRINQLLSNVASEKIKPAINPLTEIVTIKDKRILIIDVPQGVNKPYQDNNGIIWVKSGADKRKATAREELQRLFQSSGLIHADEAIISEIVFEELVTNALMHRDYFISAPIRIFIFSDRIEIISPGHLPNNLTLENIKAGNSNIRNPVLASFATKLLPYRGLGSGIRRALKAYPNIDFIDDRDGNLFQCTIRRIHNVKLLESQKFSS